MVLISAYGKKILLFLVLFSLIPASASALADYAYRIDNSIPDGARPYQLSINITNSTGTNNATDIFTQGHCFSTNCSDIAFYSNDVNLLSYWVETNISTGVRGRVWINATENGTITMRYGASGQTSQSNGNATFIQWHGSATSNFLDSLTVNSTKFVFESIFTPAGSNRLLKYGLSNNAVFATDDSILINVYDGGNINQYTTYNEGSGSFSNTAPALSTSAAVRFKILKTSTNAEFFINDISQTNLSTNLPNENLGIGLEITRGTPTIQWAFVRNYATTEPVWATWGTEQAIQTFIPATPTNLNATTGNFWVNTTWEPGAGNVTNSYNVSVNGTWTNGSTNAYINSSIPAHGWANVSIYAYNSSNTGTLNATPATKNTQVPNNLPVMSSNVVTPTYPYPSSTLSDAPSATDADSDSVVYTYQWYVDGSIIPGATSSTLAPPLTLGSTYKVSVTPNDGYGSGTATYSNEVTVVAEPFIPPVPTANTVTTGNFWVNFSWLPGAGNVTNSYNVSVNGTWTNGTTDTFVNTTLSPHAWHNVTVWAYNSSVGNLSATSLTNNTQIPNNPTSQAVIGNKNVTAGDLLNFTIVAVDDDSDTLTYGTNASKGTFNTTTGNFNWSTENADIGTYIWYFNSSDSYSEVATETITVTVSPSYIPPAPVNLTNSTGNYWVNYTWEPGAGNVTNSYNVSVNGTWTNGTTSTWLNTTTVASGWVNISVYAFNATGSGTLNATAISQSTQAPAAPAPEAADNSASPSAGSGNFVHESTTADALTSQEFGVRVALNGKDARIEFPNSMTFGDSPVSALNLYFQKPYIGDYSITITKYAEFASSLAGANQYFSIAPQFAIKNISSMDIKSPFPIAVYQLYGNQWKELPILYKLQNNVYRVQLENTGMYAIKAINQVTTQGNQVTSQQIGARVILNTQHLINGLFSSLQTFKQILINYLTKIVQLGADNVSDSIERKFANMKWNEFISRK